MENTNLLLTQTIQDFSSKALTTMPVPTWTTNYFCQLIFQIVQTFSHCFTLINFCGWGKLLFSFHKRVLSFKVIFSSHALIHQEREMKFPCSKFHVSFTRKSERVEMFSMGLLHFLHIHAARCDDFRWIKFHASIDHQRDRVSQIVTQSPTSDTFCVYEYENKLQHFSTRNL